jgi:hypothetical protein
MESGKIRRKIQKSLDLSGKFSNSCSKLEKCTTFKYRPQDLSQKTLIKSKRGLSASFIRRSTISDPNKYHSEILARTYSNILSGLDTFQILSVIKSKDSHFHIPVPTSIIINCGFQKIMLVDSEKVLKIQEAFEITDAIKFLKKLHPNVPDTQPFTYPLAVMKYREDKILEFSINSLGTFLLNLKPDLIIQKFIMPKGLRIAKYRVILNEFKKVLIFSNKNRFDCKIDTRASFGPKDKELTQDMIRTVIFHKDVKKAMKTGTDWKEITSLKEEVDNEKIKFVKIFQNKTVNTHSTNTEINNCSPSIRFLTSNQPGLTSLFEGKNQSFSEIIQMTEYLWGKIDYYYLDNSKLTELACDFLQDKEGNWYFLKIKYGKTEFKEIYKTISKSRSKKTRLIVKDL